MKEFHVGSNYLVNVTVRLENTSGQSLSLPAQEWVVGTATPMGPDDNGLYGGAMWFDGAKAQDHQPVVFQHQHHVFVFLFQDSQTEYLRRHEQCCLGGGAQPVFRADGDAETNRRSKSIARPVICRNFQMSSRRRECRLPEGIQTALVYPAQTLRNNQRSSGRLSSLRGRRNIGLWRASGRNFKTAPTS